MRLKDIAAAVGVSISTVSRVLNDPYSSAASPETQELIWKVARDGGYIPNPIARELQAGNAAATAAENRVICCMIATDPKEYKDDAFYSVLTSSIRAEALRNNYIVEYYFYGADQEKREPMPSRSKNVRGLIILGRFRVEILPELIDKFRNIVYIGSKSIRARCDRVVCDGYDAMLEVVKCYHENGHRFIGYIGAPDDRRIDGYKAALREYGLPLKHEYVVDSISLSSDEGYISMLRLLDNIDPAQRMTAVVCANDVTAIGALAACKERGIRVPEDINIIGMNDIEITRYVSPTLTTVHVPMDEMGAYATRLLIDRINGGHQQSLEVRFPFWIVTRESGPTRITPGA